MDFHSSPITNIAYFTCKIVEADNTSNNGEEGSNDRTS